MEISEKLIEFAKNHAYPTADVKDVNMVPFVTDYDNAPYDLAGNPLYAEDIREAAIAKKLVHLVFIPDEDTIACVYSAGMHVTDETIDVIYLELRASQTPLIYTISFPYRPTEPAEEDGD